MVFKFYQIFNFKNFQINYLSYFLFFFISIGCLNFNCEKKYSSSPTPSTPENSKDKKSIQSPYPEIKNFIHNQKISPISSNNPDQSLVTLPSHGESELEQSIHVDNEHHFQETWSSQHEKNESNLNIASSFQQKILEVFHGTVSAHDSLNQEEAIQCYTNLKKLFIYFFKELKLISFNSIKIQSILNPSFLITAIEPVKTNSVDSLCKQEMLVYLQHKDHTSLTLESSLKNTVNQLHTLKEHWIIAKDFLAICYEYGVGVQQNQQKAQQLKNEVQKFYRSKNIPRFPFFLGLKLRILLEKDELQLGIQGVRFLSEIKALSFIEDKMDEFFIFEHPLPMNISEFCESLKIHQPLAQQMAHFLKYNNPPSQKYQLIQNCFKFKVSHLVQAGIEEWFSAFQPEHLCLPVIKSIELCMESKNPSLVQMAETAILSFQEFIMNHWKIQDRTDFQIAQSLFLMTLQSNHDALKQWHHDLWENDQSEFRTQFSNFSARSFWSFEMQMPILKTKIFQAMKIQDRNLQNQKMQDIKNIFHSLSMLPAFPSYLPKIVQFCKHQRANSLIKWIVQTHSLFQINFRKTAHQENYSILKNLIESEIPELSKITEFLVEQYLANSVNSPVDDLINPYQCGILEVCIESKNPNLIAKVIPYLEAKNIFNPLSQQNCDFETYLNQVLKQLRDIKCYQHLEKVGTVKKDRIKTWLQSNWSSIQQCWCSNRAIDFAIPQLIEIARICQQLFQSINNQESIQELNQTLNTFFISQDIQEYIQKLVRTDQRWHESLKIHEIAFLYSYVL